MVNANEAAWDKTFEVNLKGPYFMIQNAAGLMRKTGGGAIVNISSVNALRPSPMQGMYSMTKAAILAMTQAYAKELAPHNIRVNALLPGLVETKFSGALIDNNKIYQQVIQQIPLGRHATPDEMAGAVLYLVSDAASFTTGTHIICDGGYLS
jgi:NAD(P)-dependent dehydrogenase (short-subunit alcohol dehydrogenase family)